MSQQIGRSRGRPRAFKGPSDTTLIQSLDRAMGVLKVVSTGNGLSLTEIAEASEQSPATVYRILITLQRRGMVAFDEAAQLWYVGLEAYRIGSAFLIRTNLVEQSRPVMQRLMAASGETANLAILDQDHVIFVSQVETHEPIRAFFRPGTSGPVHASGIGKALLAYFPEERAEALVAQLELAAFTDKTITEKQALLDELTKIRGRGWSVDDEERNNGMRCIAAPIFNPFGEAVAGISVSGPSVRVTPDKDADVAALVKTAADEITRAIGGRPPEA